MAPNSCSFENFENLHFNPFRNESFSDSSISRFFNMRGNVGLLKKNGEVIASAIRDIYSE